MAYDRQRYERTRAARYARGVSSNGSPWVAEPTEAQMWDKETGRFWRMVSRADGCWPWTGATNRSGYGKITIRGSSIGAHRFSYRVNVGPIPHGMLVLHRCDNPPCVNPDHLWLGTPADNMADKVAKGRQARGIAVSYRRSPNPARGSRTNHAKATEAMVPEIRALHAAGAMSLREIGMRYGIAAQTVLDMVRRKSWAHVP